MNYDLQFLLQGGPIMWPLFLCGVISIAVIIDRFLAIGTAVRSNEQFLARVGEMVKAGRLAAALALCEETSGRIPAVIAGGIRTDHLDHVWVERSMEEMALKQLPDLTSRLSVLDSIVTLAPLLGLLGTVTGMISAFKVVGTAAGVNPTAITGGVSEALVATSAGLTIAIVTLPLYNLLAERVKDNVAEIELRTTQYLNIVARVRHDRDAAAGPDADPGNIPPGAASIETAAHTT